MKYPHVFSLTPVALAVMLSACATTPLPTPQPLPRQQTQAPVPQGPATLATLDQMTVVIPRLDDTLAANHSQLQKISEQNAQAASGLAAPLATSGRTPSPSAPVTLDEEVNNKLNEGIYKQLLTQAKNAPDPGTANAYLQVARKLKLGDPNLVAEKEELALLEENVTFYQDLLERMTEPDAKAEVYYNLAKTYDLLGKRQESIQTLKTLAEQFPDNSYMTEINFRLAEDAFASNHFLAAADFYGKVQESKNEFYDQATYKRGWALYRAGEYEQALPMFFGYAEKIMIKPNKSKQEEAALQDSYDVISLCFIQLDGAKTADAYFEKNGEQFYEAGIYANLANAYLGKKLFRDAAETYESFIKRHPFDPSAPQLSSAIINIYDLGGFPSLVIQAKEEFINHYSVDGEYWKQANDETREKLKPILVGHVADLAKHYHALAQRDNDETNYLKAATWYRKSLQMQPAEADAITVNQLLAEALYSAKHYEEAIPEFEKTAYEYNNPKAADAAYFALLSYQEWDASLGKDNEARKKLLPRRAASVFKYVDKFPQDQNTPIVLQGLTQFLYEQYPAYDEASKPLVATLADAIFKLVAAYPQDKNSALLLQGLTNLYIHFKDFDGTVKAAQTMLAINPPVDEKLRLEAATVIANAQYDAGRFEEADKSYQQVLAFGTLKDTKERAHFQSRLVDTYYRQASKLNDDKKPEEAAAMFQRAAQATSDPAVRAKAEFDAATVLLNGEKFKEAIPVLLAFKEKYPTHELGKTLPEKLATAYEKVGDTANAALQYQAIAQRDQKKDPAKAREALWLSAEMLEKINKTDDAMRIYKQYAADASNPVATRAEATYKIYNYHLKGQQIAEQQADLKALAQIFDKGGDKLADAKDAQRVRYLGAMAHFKLSQPLYDSYAALPLKQPLKQSILVKRKAMVAALQAYNQVAAIGVAEFTTAANYQQGEIYRNMASELIHSEKPKGLSDLAQEQYGILLEEQAEPLTDKAIEIHSANTDLVKQEIYDTYVQKSFAAMAELSPGRYNKREQLEDAIEVIY